MLDPLSAGAQQISQILHVLHSAGLITLRIFLNPIGSTYNQHSTTYNLLYGGGGGGQRPKRPHTYKKSKKGPRKRGFLGPFGAF